MPNAKNLKANSERTPKERKELAQKAGKKSGEARREKKLLKEELMLLLAQGKTQEKISLALIEEAIKGNVKAFEVIRDTIGEKPKDIVENVNPPVINITGVKI
jgi:hypothetical protein